MTPVRVVLAAVLAVALVAAAMPAVEDAADARATTAARTQVEDLRRAIETLRRQSDPTPQGVPGARETVDLSLSVPGGLGARLAYVAVGGVPGRRTAADGPGRDVLAYRLHGREPRVAVVVPVELRAVIGGTVRADDEPLVVRGDRTLVFELVRQDGSPVVHTFIRHRATTGDHA